MKNLAVVTWTHTEMEDVFPVYFGNLKKYFPEHLSYNNYVLIDKLNESISDDYTQLVNNENDTRSLTVSCPYPVNGYHVFSVNARLHYKPGNETCEQDTLLISLPTFEYDPILF